jgi:hypothetical protein
MPVREFDCLRLGTAMAGTGAKSKGLSYGEPLKILGFSVERQWAV